MADGRLLNAEPVGVGLARGDQLLGDRGDAVLVVGHVDAVPVDVSSERQFVGHLDLDLVADLEIDPWTGHHPVVGPGLDDLSWTHLPVDDRGGQLEALRAVFEHLGFQRQVATPLGLGGEGEYRVHHQLVEGGALLGSHCGVILVAAGRRDLVTCGCADHERGRHSGIGVPGDLAEQRVVARLQAAQVECCRPTRFDVRRDQVGALDAEVVDL